MHVFDVALDVAEGAGVEGTDAVGCPLLGFTDDTLVGNDTAPLVIGIFTGMTDASALIIELYAQPGVVLFGRVAITEAVTQRTVDFLAVQARLAVQIIWGGQVDAAPATEHHERAGVGHRRH